MSGDERIHWPEPLGMLWCGFAAWFLRDWVFALPIPPLLLAWVLVTLRKWCWECRRMETRRRLERMRRELETGDID